MADRGLLYLAAAPRTPVAVPTIFRSEGVRQVLENPPVVRSATRGFDLQTLERARIVEGTKLAIASGERKKIELFPDGSFLAIAPFAGFLGWPRDEQEFAHDPKINSLAMIEFIFDFVLTYDAILDYVEPVPESVAFRVGLREMQLSSGETIYLAPHGLKTYGYELGPYGHAPRESADFDPVDLVVATDRPHLDVGTTVFALVARIYTWFGLEEDKVPYTNENHDEISPEAIRAV